MVDSKPSNEKLEARKRSKQLLEATACSYEEAAKLSKKKIII